MRFLLSVALGLFLLGLMLGGFESPQMESAAREDTQPVRQQVEEPAARDTAQVAGIII